MKTAPPARQITPALHKVGLAGLAAFVIFFGLRRVDIGSLSLIARVHADTVVAWEHFVPHIDAPDLPWWRWPNWAEERCIVESQSIALKGWHNSSRGPVLTLALATTPETSRQWGIRVPAQPHSEPAGAFIALAFHSVDGLKLLADFADIGAIEVTTEGLDLEIARRTAEHDTLDTLTAQIQPAADREIPVEVVNAIELIRAEPESESYISDWTAEGRLRPLRGPWHYDSNPLTYPLEDLPGLWGAVLLGSPSIHFRSGDRWAPLTIDLLQGAAPLGARFSVSGNPVVSFRLAVKSVVFRGLVGAVLPLPDGQRTIAPQETLHVQMQQGEPGVFTFDSNLAQVSLDARVEDITVDGSDLRPRRINFWPWYAQAVVWAMFGYLVAPWLTRFRWRS